MSAGVQPVDGMLRVPIIATLIGRTPRRVQQLIVGMCTVEPLPADLIYGQGRGYYVTSVESFVAWQSDQWERARKW